MVKDSIWHAIIPAIALIILIIGAYVTVTTEYIIAVAIAVIIAIILIGVTFPGEYYSSSSGGSNYLYQDSIYRANYHEPSSLRAMRDESNYYYNQAREAYNTFGPDSPKISYYTKRAIESDFKYRKTKWQCDNDW